MIDYIPWLACLAVTCYAILYFLKRQLWIHSNLIAETYFFRKIGEAHVPDNLSLEEYQDLLWKTSKDFKDLTLKFSAESLKPKQKLAKLHIDNQGLELAAKIVKIVYFIQDGESK